MTFKEQTVHTIGRDIAYHRKCKTMTICTEGDLNGHESRIMALQGLAFSLRIDKSVAVKEVEIRDLQLRLKELVRLLDHDPTPAQLAELKELQEAVR